MKVIFNRFCSPVNVERLLMDPMGGEEDGTVILVHVPPPVRRQLEGGGVMFWDAIILCSII